MPLFENLSIYILYLNWTRSLFHPSTSITRGNFLWFHSFPPPLLSLLHLHREIWKMASLEWRKKYEHRKTIHIASLFCYANKNLKRTQTTTTRRLLAHQKWCGTSKKKRKKKEKKRKKERKKKKEGGNQNHEGIWTLTIFALRVTLSIYFKGILHLVGKKHDDYNRDVALCGYGNALCRECFLLRVGRLLCWMCESVFTWEPLSLQDPTRKILRVCSWFSISCYKIKAPIIVFYITKLQSTNFMLLFSPNTLVF